ncbi:MAG: hypothetical protein JXB03_02070 [Spirochaetales bacterium]|nr:hypothetical protein [Spirochaetales bacterium]
MKHHIFKFVCISMVLFTFGMVTLCGQEQENALIATKPLNLNFVVYSGVGMGAGVTTEGSAYPQAVSSTGIRLFPWLAIGGFLQGAPLSDFNGWNNGLSIAGQDNSYMFSSGTEVLFMPFPAQVIHPILRVTIGGITTGYLENTDDDEDMERATQKRSFFASLGAGAEANITSHLRLFVLAGGRFSGNGTWNGMASGLLSGLEASAGVRIQWGTSIR